jgi:DNA-binding transcriptional ArsR family regulator
MGEIKMKTIEEIFERLFDYYNAANISELSRKIDTSPSTVSKWMQRNSISAIKKKCRELRIYKEIFEDENKKQNTLSSTLHKEDVNVLLFALNIRSLLYVLYMLEKEEVKNSQHFYIWKESTNENEMFIKFVSSSFPQIKDENISFFGCTHETNRFLGLFVRDEKLDFVFQNRGVFKHSIIWMISQKLEGGL